MKLLNNLFICIVYILLFTSTLAIIGIHWELASRPFLISPEGISNYLYQYGSYQALFTGTIATTAAFLGLKRLQVAAEANKDKLRQDRFVEWKAVLETRLLNIEKADPWMKRPFIKERWNLFCLLYTHDFNVTTKEQLLKAFDIFGEAIQFFESSNKSCMDKGEIYPNTDYAYGFDSFHYLMIGALNIVYENYYHDLRQAYLSKLPAQRIIINPNHML